MYYRLNNDGTVMDFSQHKYSDDCLFTQKKIFTRADGAVYLEDDAPVEPYAEKKKRITDELSLVTQEFLDKQAQEYGYDDCKTACTYVDTGVARFDAEGKAFRQWRSAVWEVCFDIVAEVVDDGCEMPSEDELIAEFPTFKVTYA